MPYAQGRDYYDADSHIMETLDWLRSYANPDVREELLPIMAEKYKSGLDPRMVRAIELALKGLETRRSDAAALAEAEKNVMQTKGWAALGALDSAERSHTLDVLGFKAQLVFGSGAYGQYAYAADPRVVYGGARAFNRGIAEFCAADPRLIAVGHVPFNVPETAFALAREAIELGCGALCLNLGATHDRSVSHPDFDPVYSLMEEADVPFMLHLSVGTSPEGSRVVPSGYRNSGREKKEFAMGGERMRALDFIAIPFIPEMTLAAMALDGVFERHPRLRGGVIEQGAMWVIPWLYWLDSAARGFQRNEPYLAELSLKPSEYVRRQVRFTPYPGEPLAWMIENTGIELFMFSTDYPHPEGGRDPLARFERHLAEFDEATKERFYAQNFRELMGSQMPAPRA